MTQAVHQLPQRRPHSRFFIFSARAGIVGGLFGWLAMSMKILRENPHWGIALPLLIFPAALVYFLIKLRPPSVEWLAASQSNKVRFESPLTILGGPLVFIGIYRDHNAWRWFPMSAEGKSRWQEEKTKQQNA